ncbi:MAG TPA: Beta-galactosidase C-terminal domain, partial [Edaphobacter sp.]|nr:Beta-galactosidase C-terminal domain [Edaphobacter sp.]
AIPGLPEGVEASTRASAETHRAVVILLNHTASSQHIKLPRSFENILATHILAANTIDLPPHGVAVLMEPHAQ